MSRVSITNCGHISNIDSLIAVTAFMKRNSATGRYCNPQEIVTQAGIALVTETPIDYANGCDSNFNLELVLDANT